MLFVESNIEIAVALGILWLATPIPYPQTHVFNNPILGHGTYMRKLLTRTS